MKIIAKQFVTKNLFSFKHEKALQSTRDRLPWQTEVSWYALQNTEVGRD